MNTEIKYVHTNLIAKDWRRLAEFYIQVFNCKPILPERDLKGDWIDKITKIKDVSVKGIHLRLPGYDNGPTLEIFEYEPTNYRNTKNEINHQGFGHIAFHVNSVDKTLEKVMEHGGGQLGETIVKEYDNLGTLTVVYAKDPEGNFIELQNWNKGEE